MSETHVESDRGAGAATPAGAEGLCKDPHEVTGNRMELRVQGYIDPLGYTRTFKKETVQHTKVREQTINWTRITIPRLMLSQTAHILLLQGIAPVKFFLGASLMGRMQGRPELTLHGPLLFIKGMPSRPWEVPAHIDKLVLGQLYPDFTAKEQKISVMEVFNVLIAYEARRAG